ncbi:MAG TPA: hypothetical protein OIL90_09740 [Phascolarctobacterium faecium]|uniref:hypothetical protein n=1 Tax=Phascolarctobacterium faecium TaxID=33025 RepID=UPI00242D181E|nr:hypothetical protein [Phascolarctobacterium faecium]HJI10386.1 hypothetical protein [Phascolarctobacterium faecium]
MGFSSRGLAATMVRQRVTVQIVQPAHGVISVTVDGVAHTATFDTLCGANAVLFWDAQNSNYTFVKWNIPEIKTAKLSFNENVSIAAAIVEN